MVLKNGWTCYFSEETGSTNDAIKEYCRESGQRIAFWAKRQTSGRGRRGRSWLSAEGNLFLSLALEFELRNLGQLVVVSALSLLQAIKKLAPFASVRLKWPNDVLLNDAKVSGILLEKGEGAYIIVGIGVNVRTRPPAEQMPYSVISLAEAGIETTAEELLTLYLDSFSQNLSRLQTEGFAALRQKWLENAKNPGGEIIVRQEGEEVKGIFRGIDENAALMLEVNGQIRKVLAGDVFFNEIK